MERQVKDYEVTGEHKLIREITRTYVTSNGVEEELRSSPHRGGYHAPGTLDGETYVQTDMASLPTEVAAIAGLFWDSELNHSYEALLEAQQAEQNAR